MSVHYRVHSMPLLETILGQMNPIPTPTPYLSKIHLILSSHLRLDLPTDLLFSGFVTKLYMHSQKSTCVVHTPLTLCFLI